MKTRWAFVLMVLVPLALVSAVALAQPQPGLINPSFEGGWHEQGAGELVIPNGWTLEYRDGNHPWCEPPCNRPEVKPNEEFVTDGRYSIRSFTTFSRGLYGIWQEVAVPPGSWWTFACDTRIDSNPPGELAAFVGIQPWGAGLFERQMVWGKETQVQLEWRTVSVTAQAFGPRIRVVMGANNKWPTRGNTIWWDACELRPADPSGAQPTATPRPTYTPYPTPEPCPTCTPGGACDYGIIRGIVRTELDRTIWTGGAGP